MGRLAFHHEELNEKSNKIAGRCNKQYLNVKEYIQFAHQNHQLWATRLISGL